MRFLSYDFIAGRWQLRPVSGSLTLDNLNLTDRLNSYDGAAPANGELLIGSGNDGFARATLTAGAGVAITNEPGAITISTAVNYQEISASYTLQLSDQGKTLRLNPSVTMVLTIPSNNTTPFPIGTTINLLITGGTVYLDVSQTPGIVALTALPTHTLFRGVEYQIRKRSANIWEICAINLPCRQFQFESTNFISNTDVGFLSTTNSGAGANLTVVSGTVDAANPGAVQVETGTTATGYRVLNTQIQALLLEPNQAIYTATSVAADALPTGTEDFTIRSGLQNSIVTLTASGVFFRSRSTSNGGLYQCVARTSSTETVINTAVNPTNFNRLEILFIPAVEARYWINGSYIGAITTDLPPVLNAAGMICGITKTAGTNSRRLIINSAQLGLTLY